MGYIRHLSPEELKQLKKDRIKEKRERKKQDQKGEDKITLS